MRTQRTRSPANAALGALFVALLGLSGCVGGPKGTPDEKRAYFKELEDSTLARLFKEHPATQQEWAESVGYAVVEKKIVKIPVFGAGSGAGVVVEKASGTRTYLHVPELQFGAGWGARGERIVLIFQDLKKLRDLSDGEWHSGLSAEAAAKAGDIGAAGGADGSKIGKQGFTTYVLTESGVSATVTLTVLRAQPYSID